MSINERPEALNNQAILLASEGHTQEAIACYKRALSLDSTNVFLWFNLGITYRDLGNLKEANDYLEKAYNLDQTNMDCCEAYIANLISLKKLSLAESICQGSLTLSKTNPNLWNLLGVINFQKENYEDAETYFQMSLMIEPYHIDALYNLRDTYDIRNNKAGVSECKKRIKELGL